MSGLLGPRAERRLRARKSRAGYAQLAYFAIALALSYIAGQLLKKKSNNPLDGNKPTTLTARGSYISWVTGVRRVGPVFAFAGDRHTKSESQGGGKGAGGGQDVDVFYESGWHQLAVGQGHALHQIIQQGKVIFQGPITSVSHPSGTVVDLGQEGSFVIYWGEIDQPLNTYLADPARLGISSRWPLVTQVYWIEKRLSTSPQWPVLDYVVEMRTTQSVLTGTPAQQDPTEALTGPTANVFAVLANAAPDTGYLELVGDYTQEFPADGAIFTTGTGLPNGRKVVRRSIVVLVNVGTNPITGLPIFSTRTRLFLETGTAGATATGTVQGYVRELDDGINPAHIIAEVLFAQWPKGLELETAGPEPWDLQSLEDLGQLCVDEDIRGSMIATQGDQVDSVLGQALQDLGVLLTLDTLHEGALKFTPVRSPTGVLPVITPEVHAQELPEQEISDDDLAVDKIIFSFDNRERQFVTDTFQIGDDGSARLAQFSSADEVGIASTVVFRSAGAIAERRSQEALGGGAKVPLSCNRGARELQVGQAIFADDFDDILRVVGVKADPLSGKVVVTCLPDTFGVDPSTYVNQPGGGSGAGQPVQEDPLFSWVEVPEYLNAAQRKVSILVPRVRAHGGIISAGLHISGDNTSYEFKGNSSYVYAGGISTDALDATSNELLELGPAFTAAGPDIGTVQDYTAFEANWKLGRQLCVIDSDGGTEICFLRNIQALGGGSYRLRGLLRARYDTRRVTHPAGARVYIFAAPPDSEAVFDGLLTPSSPLYLKTQPSSTSGQVPLSNIAPYANNLVGKGITPMQPENLRASAPRHMVPAYMTGEDVTVRWNYQSAVSPNTGAGMQGYGTPVGASPVDGTFEVQVTTTADVVVQTTTQTSTSFTLTNAQIIALLGSEVSFKVKIRNVRGGYSSAQTSLTVTKL